MPWEIIGEVTGGILRVVGRFFLEFVLELFIMGAGDIWCCIFRPNSKPSDTTRVIVGVLFWIALGAAAYGLYRLGRL
jgi:hypothetical protein